MALVTFKLIKYILFNRKAYITITLTIKNLSTNNERIFEQLLTYHRREPKLSYLELIGLGLTSKMYQYT